MLVFYVQHMMITMLSLPSLTVLHNFAHTLQICIYPYILYAFVTKQTRQKHPATLIKTQ